MASPKYLLVFISLLLAGTHFTHGFLDKSLLKLLTKLGKADVLVHFAGENSPVLENIKRTDFQSRQVRVEALCSGLHALRQYTQGPVIKFLKGFGADYQSFWVSNQLVIRNANIFLVQGVDAFPQVYRVRLLPTIKLSPRPSKVKPLANATVQWGVAKIQADQVWSTFKTTGEGVVVANIDTGVRGTHEALAGNFRLDHGWYDPYSRSRSPRDGNGHGTHTMGTIAGQNGIGVAPGSTWIACRGCGSNSCDAAQLLSCGQWMLSPTNPNGSDPDPSKIPDVVSNSWGGGSGDNWYNATIEAWNAAGILHAFAIGNSGPNCRSGGSPGDQQSTFSVGSTDSRDRLSSFSSKGPAGRNSNSYTKPDVAAPGSNIYSAWKNNDRSYNTISGTSMATPHVAGTMALMLSAYRQTTGDSSARLTMDQVVNILEKTADNQNLTVVSPNYRCQRNQKYPNNQFGYGRINALNAVAAVISEAASNTDSTSTTTTALPDTNII